MFIAQVMQFFIIFKSKLVKKILQIPDLKLIFQVAPPCCLNHCQTSSGHSQLSFALPPSPPHAGWQINYIKMCRNTLACHFSFLAFISPYFPEVSEGPYWQDVGQEVCMCLMWLAAKDVGPVGGIAVSRVRREDSAQPKPPVRGDMRVWVMCSHPSTAFICLHAFIVAPAASSEGRGAEPGVLMLRAVVCL